MSPPNLPPEFRRSVEELRREFGRRMCETSRMAGLLMCEQARMQAIFDELIGGPEAGGAGQTVPSKYPPPDDDDSRVGEEYEACRKRVEEAYERCKQAWSVA